MSLLQNIVAGGTGLIGVAKAITNPAGKALTVPNGNQSIENPQTKIRNAKAPYVAGKVGEYTFPHDIESLPHFFMMSFVKYDYKTQAQTNKSFVNLKQTEANMILPLPANIQEQMSFSWQDVSLGMFGGPAMEKIGEVVNQYQSGAGAYKTTSDAVQAFTSSIQEKETWNALFRRALNQVGSVGNAVDILSGSVPNPHVAIAFQGVALRKFNFQWRLAPYSAAESVTINNIIRKLKEVAHPEINNFFLDYPHVMHCRFMADQFLFNFKPMAITGLEINYAPNGTPSFFGTTAPTEVTISMSAQELAIHTKQDYEEKISDYY